MYRIFGAAPYAICIQHSHIDRQKERHCRCNRLFICWFRMRYLALDMRDGSDCTQYDECGPINAKWMASTARANAHDKFVCSFRAQFNQMEEISLSARDTRHGIPNDCSSIFFAASFAWMQHSNVAHNKHTDFIFFFRTIFSLPSCVTVAFVRMLYFDATPQQHRP